MIVTLARLSLLLIAILPIGSARAAFEAAAYERALFRTFTLLYATAPRQTIVAATQCASAATAGLPDTFRIMIIEIDRRPVYRGNDRLQAIVESLAPLDIATTKPMVDCFSHLGAGDFGSTAGAIPATAAPKPNNIAACPIYMDRVSESAISCYCQPMLGGIVYGDKTYSDASSICLAARHAGAVDYLTGGVVMAFFEPGCANYKGTEGNGTVSSTSGKTRRSFHFPNVGKGECPK